MHVEFLTNLGSRDAQRFDLDFTKCTKGAVVEVEDSVGESLCTPGRKGMTFARSAEAPKSVKAVAKAPEIKGEAKDK